MPPNKQKAQAIVQNTKFVSSMLKNGYYKSLL